MAANCEKIKYVEKIIIENCTHKTRNNFKECWWQLNKTPIDLAKEIVTKLEEG